METPPPTPDARPPLSRAFYTWLLVPVVSMAVAAAACRNSELQGFGLLLLMATLVAMLVCSIVCAVMVRKREGYRSGVLMFMGALVIYFSVAFAGCAA